jgi:hypothetical protein
MKKRYTAIVFFKDKNLAPFKYRNIDNFISFESYLFKTFQNLDYINYYDKETKLYIKRNYFNQ